MSYKALYRTYRPINFNSVIGQDHIITTLKNIIRAKKVSHAYLFSGPRGTGKTSVAKVFANVVNCTDLINEFDPCKICYSCTEAQKGVSLDIIEIDAASNNGVAEIRELRENVKYSPSNSKYKIYIIDEVHMLSKGAFNALLKTLEEPPKHAIFILATTEAHKIPVTILSRTQRFNFRRISENILEEHLRKILDAEGYTYDKESLMLISQLSNGGVRDALSIADQAAAFTNGKLTFDSISQVFGVISKSNQIKLLNYSSEGNIEGLLNLANKFIEEGANLKRIVESLINIIKDFIVFTKTSQNSLLSYLNDKEILLVKTSISDAYLNLDILIKLHSELTYTEVPTQSFELAMIKMSLHNESKRSTEKIDEVKKVAGVTKSFTPNNKEASNNFDELFTTDEMQNILTNKNKIVIDDKEIDDSTQVLISENEIAEEVQQVEEEVLTTKEIKIDRDQEMEKELEESTSELDLFKMFDENIEEEDVDSKKNLAEFPINEIINLLVQTNPEAHASAKMRWVSIMSYVTNSKFGEIATFMESAKLIATGKDFIIVSSESGDIVSQINSIRKTPIFVEFINELFGRPKLIFAITRELFNDVKERYKELRVSNGLPVAKPIEKLEIKKESGEAEKLGEDLFGELFSS